MVSVLGLMQKPVAEKTTGFFVSFRSIYSFEVVEYPFMTIVLRFQKIKNQHLCDFSDLHVTK